MSLNELCVFYDRRDSFLKELSQELLKLGYSEAEVVTETSEETGRTSYMFRLGPQLYSPKLWLQSLAGDKVITRSDMMRFLEVQVESTRVGHMVLKGYTWWDKRNHMINAQRVALKIQGHVKGLQDYFQTKDRQQQETSRLQAILGKIRNDYKFLYGNVTDRLSGFLSVSGAGEFQVTFNTKDEADLRKIMSAVQSALEI